MPSKIFVKGARENNLKNIDVEIPRDALTVITGLSGSGKSSLAFDTIYAEGQRRYVESLSSYARMFLGQKEKPDVDYIEGLSPAISIDQKTTSQNPRSTVGTVTEVYDYLRLLWARVGTPHCPNCGKEIRQQTIDQIIDQIMALPEGTRIQVLAPVVRGRKGEHAKVFEDARRSGYVRVRADGNLYDLSEDIPLDKNKKHSIEIVVDRLIVRPDGAQRLTDSVETASHLSGGIVVVNLVREGQDLTFSQNYACDDCGISIEELTPRMFSFNNPFGACPTCTGLGMQLKADPALIIPDDRLSILDGAIVAPGWNSIRSDGISRMYFEALAKAYRFSLQTPVRQLSPEVRDVIFYGTRGEKLELHYDQPRGRGTLYQPFEGIANNLERRYVETQSDASRKELEELMSEDYNELWAELLDVDIYGGLSYEELTQISANLPTGTKGGDIAQAALSKAGTAYSVMDCSQLTQYAYAQAGVSLPRTSVAQAKYCYDNGYAISGVALQPGDLVFWSKACSCGRWNEIHHTGIYIGSGKIVDASSTKGRVVVRNLWGENGDKWKIAFYARPHI